MKTDVICNDVIHTPIDNTYYLLCSLRLYREKAQQLEQKIQMVNEGEKQKFVQSR